jgi:hypothetical protein
MARKKWQPWKQYFELVKVEKEPSQFAHGAPRTALR